MVGKSDKHLHINPRKPSNSVSKGFSGYEKFADMKSPPPPTDQTGAQTLTVPSGFNGGSSKYGLSREKALRFTRYVAQQLLDRFCFHLLHMIGNMESYIVTNFQSVRSSDLPPTALSVKGNFRFSGLISPLNQRVYLLA